jgi:arylsulfatase A-like enzyme
VIAWPDRIKDKGGIRSQFHHVIDIAPTILAQGAGIHPGPADAKVLRLGASFSEAVETAERSSFSISFWRSNKQIIQLGTFSFRFRCIPLTPSYVTASYR